MNQQGWEISYYFRGPDLRYNGTFVSVRGSLVAQYIEAFEKNWQEFQHLQASIPPGGEFSKPGQMGMKIRIGAFAQGVCLQSSHMPISTRQQLDRVLESYRYAATRAPAIQQMLRSL